MAALGKAGFARECAHPSSTLHSENAAQIWPQVMARHPGDALDLYHKLGIDERLAVPYATIECGNRHRRHLSMMQYNCHCRCLCARARLKIHSLNAKTGEHGTLS